jgi:arabinose-5-phosphate isomerase
MLSKEKKSFLAKDLMLLPGKFPIVSSTTMLKEALDEMTTFKIGVCCIVENEKLTGIITDGDFRRKVLQEQKPIASLLVDDVILHAITKPISIYINENIDNAVKIMENNLIWDLPVVDKENKLHGLLHLHPVVKKILSI